MTSPLIRWPIASLEFSEAAPSKDNMPGCPWPALGFPRGEKYQPAFDVQTQDDADLHLLMCVGHTLRYHYFTTDSGILRPGTWLEAFAIERAELGWFAFAKDIGKDGPYTSFTAPDGRMIRVEDKTWRDFAWKMYKAKMPDMTPKKEDIGERVEQRREKEARKKGVNYQRIRTPMSDRPGWSGSLVGKQDADSGGSQQGGLF